MKLSELSSKLLNILESRGDMEMFIMDESGTEYFINEIIKEQRF